MELDQKLLGVRVVRGPDWKWDNQDGGEGHIGTVTGTKPQLKAVSIRWDSGDENHYRVGCKGSYDLHVLDTAPAGVCHKGATCMLCHTSPIWGLRYRCTQCESLDYCMTCYMRDTDHIMKHDFVRFDTPHTPGILLAKSGGSKCVRLVGLFGGAVVTEVGGTVGKKGVIQTLIPYGETGGERMAVIQWQHGITSTHRLANKTCIKATSGDIYYPKHLPVLGEYDESMRDGRSLQVGDQAMYMYDYTTMEEMQLGHGGWTPDMTRCHHNYGRVSQLVSDDEVRVMMGRQEWLFNRHIFRRILLSYKANPPQREDEQSSHVAPSRPRLYGVSDKEDLNIGDRARVVVDVEQLREMQEEHGGWVEGMREFIGKVGFVNLINDGIVELKYREENKWTMWAYHADAVKKVCSVRVKDKVRISSDMQHVRSILDERCGWSSSLDTLLGRVGEVTEVDSDGDMEVMIDGEPTWFDARVCTLVSQAENLQNELQPLPDYATVPRKQKLKTLKEKKMRARPKLDSSFLPPPPPPPPTTSRPKLPPSASSLFTRGAAASIPSPAASGQLVPEDSSDDEDDGYEKLNPDEIQIPKHAENLDSSKATAVAKWKMAMGVANRSLPQRPLPQTVPTTKPGRPWGQLMSDVRQFHHQKKNTRGHVPSGDMDRSVPSLKITENQIYVGKKTSNLVDDDYLNMQQNHITTRPMMGSPTTVRGGGAGARCSTTEESRHSLHQEFQNMRESLLCSICYNRQRNVVFNCGHTTCAQCSQALKICHMCRQEITHKITMYN